MKNNRNIKLDFYFPNIKNLESIEDSMLELNKKEEVSVEIKDEYILVLEKIELHKETSIGEYSITSYWLYIILYSVINTRIVLWLREFLVLFGYSLL